MSVCDEQHPRADQNTQHVFDEQPTRAGWNTQPLTKQYPVNITYKTMNALEVLDRYRKEKIQVST